jgi:hypothetical protein
VTVKPKGSNPNKLENKIKKNKVKIYAKYSNPFLPVCSFIKVQTNK